MATKDWKKQKNWHSKSLIIGKMLTNILAYSNKEYEIYLEKWKKFKSGKPTYYVIVERSGEQYFYNTFTNKIKAMKTLKQKLEQYSIK